MVNRLLLFSFLLVCCFATAAHAHKVNIFAYVDGDTIHTDSGFSKSKRVQGGVVHVQNAVSGEEYLSGVTNKDGKFSFTIPQQAYERKSDLRLVLDASQGHRGEWLVRYKEFGGGEEADQADSEPDNPQAEIPSVENIEGLRHIVRTAVKKAVAEETAPLKEMIAEMHNEDPGAREVAAGLGYLMGVVGLVTYFRSRKD